MPAFGSKTLNDLFNTAITPAGEYTLSQDVTGDNINLHKEIPVLIEVTKTISGSLQLLPLKIPSGIEIKWSIKVPGGATQILSYWLKGPDQVGTYEKDATKLPEDATKLLE